MDDELYRALPFGPLEPAGDQSMPSPFPGMDPYLEDADIFPNLHDKFIVYLEEHLQPRLPQPYFAKTSQRTWLEHAAQERYPDVSVLIGAAAAGEEEGPGGGVATASSALARPLTVTVEDYPWDERRETFLDIYTTRDGGKRLVTSIELLSPSNKTPGEESAAAYRRKQREMLQADVNLVEIDLLRRGKHSTAVPLHDLLARCGRFDYHVCVHRFDHPNDFLVYPFELGEPLPAIAIPLLPADAAVDADLQAVFERCYDTGPYRREVDYTKDPPPPALDPPRLAWIKGHISSHG